MDGAFITLPRNGWRLLPGLAVVLWEELLQLVWHLFKIGQLWQAGLLSQVIEQDERAIGLDGCKKVSYFSP
jgi:hypothetical protein